MIKKRGLLAVMVFLLVFSFMTVMTGCKNDSEAGGEDVTEDDGIFDSENIIFTYAALSDVHINTSIGFTITKFERAMKYLAENVGKDLDAVVFGGDLTDRGKNEEMLEFKTIIERNKRDFELDYDIFYALGNHDTDNAPAVNFHKVMGEDYFKNDLGTEQQRNKGNRYAKINDLYFVAVNVENYRVSRGNATFSAETKKWFKETMDTIIAEDPSKPVFVIAHCPAFGTTYGSGLYNNTSKELPKMLSDYPQAVLYTGHLHNILNLENDIMQNEFTAIGLPAVWTMGIDVLIEENEKNSKYTPVDNLPAFDRGDVSQGLLVQVDSSYNMKMTRLDFSKGCKIGKAWIVPAPKDDNSHLSVYTKDRIEDTEAPVFSEDAKLNLEVVNGTFVKASFNAASDDEFVYRYELVFKNTSDESVDTYNLTSGFYLYPDLKDMPREYSYNVLEVKSGIEYEVTLTAYDSWGKGSKILTGSIKI